MAMHRYKSAEGKNVKNRLSLYTDNELWKKVHKLKIEANHKDLNQTCVYLIEEGLKVHNDTR